jgi:SNF2 family DNA or RNA helicase
MGLGKTIQALALIISRPSLDRARKTTLIVAPVALMQQWKREIERTLKPRHRLTVLVLHGDARNTSWSNLREHDVVLTTYGLIASELKRKLKWDDKLKMYPDVRPSGKEDYQPILGDTSKWYRVILDEAQAIKNKATKAAIGASFIKSEYRWCMSGTPMQNNVTELYSLIHFLRIKPYNESDKFSRDFTRPLKSTDNRAKEKAMRQLQALLKAILLRRTKTSKIDGKPILQLPPKTTKEQRAVFSEDERDFYKALETQTQLKFNKYLKANTQTYWSCCYVCDKHAAILTSSKTSPSTLAAPLTLTRLLMLGNFLRVWLNG